MEIDIMHISLIVLALTGMKRTLPTKFTFKPVTSTLK